MGIALRTRKYSNLRIDFNVEQADHLVLNAILLYTWDVIAQIALTSP